jgi:diaminopimelate epimerase
MRFTKMHGIGNDYVYVDCFAQGVPADPVALARRIADRHRGVGGDGLILICPSEVADARMRMFNADGSEAQMCGNGIRCLAKYVYDHGIARRERLRVETGAGILTLEIEATNGTARRVKVDMGRPILEAAKIPVALPDVPPTSRVVNLSIEGRLPIGEGDAWREAAGLDGRMTCVSMGNPHLVLYCRRVAEVPLATIGPVLERASVFPERINVHFVEVHSPAEATMRTWERGSGATLACGTGASAVCVAGVLAERSGRRLLAHLPGGDLELEWSGDGPVTMTGEAAEVFSGEWTEE